MHTLTVTNILNTKISQEILQNMQKRFEKCECIVFVLQLSIV